MKKTVMPLHKGDNWPERRSEYLTKARCSGPFRRFLIKTPKLNITNPINSYVDSWQLCKKISLIVNVSFYKQIINRCVGKMKHYKNSQSERQHKVRRCPAMMHRVDGQTIAVPCHTPRVVGRFSRPWQQHSVFSDRNELITEFPLARVLVNRQSSMEFVRRCLAMGCLGLIGMGLAACSQVSPPLSTPPALLQARRIDLPYGGKNYVYQPIPTLATPYGEQAVILNPSTPAAATDHNPMSPPLYYCPRLTAFPNHNVLDHPSSHPVRGNSLPDSQAVTSEEGATSVHIKQKEIHE